MIYNYEIPIIVGCKHSRQVATILTTSTKCQEYYAEKRKVIERMKLETIYFLKAPFLGSQNECTWSLSEGVYDSIKSLVNS
jgi:hypothetical protein